MKWIATRNEEIFRYVISRVLLLAQYSSKENFGVGFYNRYSVFPENGFRSYLRTQGWIDNITRVYTEGTIFLKPGVSSKTNLLRHGKFDCS